MTNSIDRAAEIIDRLRLDSGPGGVSTAEHISQTLANTGLLMPDLPRPDRDGRWWPTAASFGNVNINPAGEIVLHSGNFRDMTLHLTPAKARNLADILNAAADRAEGAGSA